MTSPALLQHFESELAYLRRAFSDFEKLHPNAAKTLGVQSGRILDPNLQRVSDSLALVSARLQLHLDEALPQFAVDLARVISPDMLVGVPSYMPLIPAPTESPLAEPAVLPAKSMITFAKGDQPLCHFVAARDVKLHPIEITKLSVERAPFRFDVPETRPAPEAVLSLTLASLDPTVPLGDLIDGALELYVASPTARKRRLIETLLGDLLMMGIAAPGGRETLPLDQSTLKLSMRHDQTTWLPAHLSQAPGLERLRDFLAYPEKASFLTLDGLAPALKGRPEGPVEIRFFLNARGAQNVDDLTSGDLALNVVPALNYFEDQSRPIRYDHARDAVPVSPQSAEEMTVEVLQIQDVRRLLPEGERLLDTITSPNRRQAGDTPIWQERPVVGEFDRARRDISFSVTEAALAAPDEPIDFVATLLCSNGTDALTPRPGDRASFEADAVAELPFEVLAEPSMPVPPDLSANRLWDVLSLVNANFSTLFDGEDPQAQLKEALHLCAPTGFAEVANAIWEVNLEQSIAPVAVGRNVLLSAGNKVEVVLDLEALPFAPQVFARVLNDFIGSYVSYDRFFQLSVRERGRTTPYISFPKTHGSQLCG